MVIKRSILQYIVTVLCIVQYPKNTKQGRGRKSLICSALISWTCLGKNYYLLLILILLSLLLVHIFINLLVPIYKFIQFCFAYIGSVSETAKHSKVCQVHKSIIESMYQLMVVYSCRCPVVVAFSIFLPYPGTRAPDVLTFHRCC